MSRRAVSTYFSLHMVVIPFWTEEPDGTKLKDVWPICPGQSMPFNINTQAYVVSCWPLACEPPRIRRRQHARPHLSLISFTMAGLDLIQHILAQFHIMGTYLNAVDRCELTSGQGGRMASTETQPFDCWTECTPTSTFAKGSSPYIFFYVFLCDPSKMSQICRFWFAYVHSM